MHEFDHHINMSGPLRSVSLGGELSDSTEDSLEVALGQALQLLQWEKDVMTQKENSLFPDVRSEESIKGQQEQIDAAQAWVDELRRRLEEQNGSGVSPESDSKTNK